jgi:hypothetical protein
LHPIEQGKIESRAGRCGIGYNKSTIDERPRLTSDAALVLLQLRLFGLAQLTESKTL